MSPAQRTARRPGSSTGVLEEVTATRWPSAAKERAPAQTIDDYLAAVPEVLGEIDRCHPAAAKLALNRVTGLERILDTFHHLRQLTLLQQGRKKYRLIQRR